MVWFYILLFFLLLLIVSLFIRIYTKIYYIHQSNNDYLRLEVSYLGIKIIKKELPLKNLVDEGDIHDKKGEASSLHQIVENIKKGKNILTQLIHSKPLLKKICKKVKIHQLSWFTRIGTGNASSTGMFCGGLWGLKSCILELLNRYMYVDTRPVIQVTPLFQQKYSSIEIECMFSMRLGQTIYAIIRIVSIFQKKMPNELSKTVQT